MARRIGFMAGLLLLCLELIGAGLLAREGLRLAHIGRALPAQARDGLHTLTSQSPAHLDTGAVQPARAQFMVVGAGAQTLQMALQRVAPFLAPATRWRAAALELRQGNATLQAAQDGSALAVQLLATAPSLLTVGATSNSARQQLLQDLTRQQPALASALVASANLDRELSVVSAGRLARALQPSLATERQDLPLAEEALRLAMRVPTLLGSNGPKSYLLVAQDPADLRPTGGFMGSWGVLTVYHGQIVRFLYQGYVPWENVRDPQRDWPLEVKPIQRYLGFCCMAMQDANWYTDFPTTARALELFSEADQPAPLSGVIAFDPALVQALLQATGPVTLAGPSLSTGSAAQAAKPVTVTAANLVDLANFYEGRGSTPPPPGPLLGKEFLTLVAQALASRLASNSHVSLTSLGSAVLPLLNDKHVLISLDDPAAGAVLADLGWNGAVTTPPGDYLLLDEMSMSDNKIDASIARSVVDEVHLQADGSAEVTARITISNQFAQPVDRGAKTTDFRDFLRLYLPPGATNVRLSGVDDVWPLSTESGHVVASGFVVIPRQQAATVTLQYHAPAAVIASAQGPAYALHVQVQPGVAPIAFRLRVLSPAGAVVTDTSATLQHDQAWTVPAPAAPAAPVTPPAWDRLCVAYQYVAGLKGPYSTHRLAVPAECAADAKAS